MEFYRNFYDNAQAVAFGSFLDQHEVAYAIEHPTTLIDSNFVGSSLLPTAIIKINPKDFEKVNQLLLDDIDQLTTAEIDAHHLSNYATEDLERILSEQDEWAIEEIYLAKKILTQRGVTVSEAAIDAAFQEKITKLEEGKSANRFWVVTYFIFATFGQFISIILPIAAIGMGYYYAYGKETDPLGKKHYTYDQKSRDLGKILFFGGLIISAILYYIIYQSNYWYFDTEFPLF